MFRILCLMAAITSLSAKTEIVIWHAFEGFLKDKFSEIVDDFNFQSETFEVKLENKGNYTEVFKKGLEAFEKGEQPHILQVYEVATQTMMLKPEMFVPVDELMQHFFRKFDPAVYIDAVREFYSANGKMRSLPWNASTGILFYNKEAFKKAGINPERPPKTWAEVAEVGQKLVDAGYKGFTTAWPAAYHLEHVSSWHNLPFATEENGFGGLSSRLNFNGFYQVRHIANLVEWQNSGVFSYQGRFTSEPEALFKEEKCGILLQGANRYPLLKGKFPIGVGFMPYYSDIDGSPHRLNIGGSSFWILSGFDQKILKGIAQFFSYLSLPEVQSYWHEQTGYLPITEAAYYLSKKRGYYKTNPASEIAVLEVMNGKNTPYTKGVRLGNYTDVREGIMDAIEKALYGELTAQEALDEAVLKGNELLAEFEVQN